MQLPEEMDSSLKRVAYPFPPSGHSWNVLSRNGTPYPRCFELDPLAESTETNKQGHLNQVLAPSVRAKTTLDLYGHLSRKDPLSIPEDQTNSAPLRWVKEIIFLLAL